MGPDIPREGGLRYSSMLRNANLGDWFRNPNSRLPIFVAFCGHFAAEQMVHMVRSVSRLDLTLVFSDSIHPMTTMNRWCLVQRIIANL